MKSDEEIFEETQETIPFSVKSRSSLLSKKAFFVAATGQHVGKTTTCLGLVSGLLKTHKNVGFIKPIGQRACGN